MVYPPNLLAILYMVYPPNLLAILYMVYPPNLLAILYMVYPPNLLQTIIYGLQKGDLSITATCRKGDHCIQAAYIPYDIPPLDNSYI